jgi:DNA-binding transcriptional ArsR family regulator
MASKITNNTSTSEASTAARILKALADKPGSTAAEIADITKLGRSTISKELAALERAGQAIRVPGERQGRRRTADRWSPATNERLRPGQLDDLVLNYVRSADEPVGPVAVARALGRSSGAIANCLARRAKAGDLKLVEGKPRRYAIAK